MTRLRDRCVRRKSLKSRPGMRKQLRTIIAASARARSDSLTAVVLEEFGEFLFERFNFRTITDQNVGIVRVVQGVVLMIGLRIVEALERHNLGHDGLGKDLG